MAYSGLAVQAQLARLANLTTPGDYTGYGEAYCANVYAGTTGLEVVGALNVKAGFTSHTQYMELMGVANFLAGITDPKDYLEVPEALSRVT